MNTIARGEWLFDGYITSDCGATANIQTTHNYTNSSAQTFGVTIPSGMDVACDVTLVEPGVAAQAIAENVLSESQIDGAVAHLLRVRFRLGEFDDPATQPYAQIPVSVICSAEHIALARDSARQSIVLLANPHATLPLDPSRTKSVAVVGPFGNSSKINGGPNYAGLPCGGAVTVAAAVASAGFSTTVAEGCDVACASTNGFAAATAAAAAADATIVVVGIDETIEDEGLDRTYLTLPGSQAALITAACTASRGPCVVVIMSGGAIDITSAMPAVTGGVFWTGFLGGSGAPALVDTVFGMSAPAGRLSQTFYPASFVDAISMEEMNVRPGPSRFPPFSSPGRTSRFYNGTPLFPFGFGLSYTTWSTTVAGPATVSLATTRAYLVSNNRFGSLYASKRNEPVSAEYTVNVTNTGVVDSDYVVLGFLIPPGAGENGVPLQTLFGFQRVHVSAGQTVTVWLGVGARELTRAFSEGSATAVRLPLEGEWTVRIGVRGEEGGAETRFLHA